MEKENEYIDYFEICDAFAILTRQGVVLLSDDALVTQEEDRCLYAICNRIKARKNKKCSE